MADVLGFLKKAAPWITAAATGNVPALVSMAAKTVSDVVGGKAGTSADSIAAAVAGATPEQLQALKQADNDFALKMQALGFQHVEELEQLAAADRANAREREIQVKDKTPRILAAVVVILVFAGEGWYFTHGAPSNASPELIGRILGTLDSALILVLSYYFGSSAGSDRKTEILANGNGQH